MMAMINITLSLLSSYFLVRPIHSQETAGIRGCLFPDLDTSVDDWNFPSHAITSASELLCSWKSPTLMTVYPVH